MSNDFAKNSNTSFFVRIDSFSESSIDMLVQTFTETNDWGEYLKIKLVFNPEFVTEKNANYDFLNH